ncbi:MAG: transposase [Betaproteobacteria bacterium]|nr:transposase [Betaproteobacteria bacterium]
MATGKGVIQGYTGVAAVDGEHQIIVAAQAHGTGSEQELLWPVVTAMQRVLADHSVITADAGYHSEENLQKIAALIADNGMRGRDERSRRRTGIRKRRIRCTTKRRPRKKSQPISPATSPTTPKPIPVCAQ